MNSDKRLCRKWAFWVKYWPVCKIPTTQVAELKFCIRSQMVNTYHWWKFQVKRQSRTWVPEGGQRVFYRPVCKVPNDHVTNFFRTLINFIDQFGLLEQFSAKFIEPITLIPHLGFRPPIWTFWSVKYQPDRWPTQIFANNLVLLYTTLGQNFKFLAFVVFEISGGLRGGASMLRC